VNRLSISYKILILLLTFIPIIYLIYMVARYTVDILSFDEWYLVPFFEKMFNHSLTIKDLWNQFNEHRLVFPIATTLLMGRLTGWNLQYETALGVLFGLGIFISLIYLLKGENKYFKKYSIYLIFPTISFLVFSFNQFENWLWGIQKLIFMNLLSVTLGIILLTRFSITWRSVLLAAIFGIVATYSFASGLLYWPIALALFYLHPKIAKGLKIKWVTLWITISLLALLSYFIGYSKPPYDPPIPMTLALKHPVEYTKYALMLLGSPLEIIHRDRAVIIATLGLITYFYLVYRLFKAKLANTTLVLSQLALSSYAIANCLVTAAGRIGLGLPSRPASRYVTIPEVFWTATVVLLFLNINMSAKNKIVTIFTTCAIALITVLSINSSIQGTKVALNRYTFLSDVRSGLLQSNSLDNQLRLWGYIYPRANANGLKQVTNITQLNKDLYTLVKHRLSIFRN